MAKMKAAMAAVLAMEKEGVTQAFGVPGAAINPLYAQMRERQSIAHVLARHEMLKRCCLVIKGLHLDYEKAKRWWI